jgi:integrase
MVNGKPWKPKCNKFREVPLSTKAKAIMVERCAALDPDDLVFPNKGGAPYIRLDYAPKDSGKGFFPDAVKAAGMKGSMTFKHLRHLFAVRLLTRGVPITVVSELLGHSNIQLTVKRYGRFASDARVKWDALKVLDRHDSATRAER